MGKNKVVIYTLSGTNFGDNLITLSEVLLVSSIKKNMEIILLSPHPKDLKAFIKNNRGILNIGKSKQIKIRNAKNILSVVKSLRNSNLFIFGGGGLLDENVSLHVSLYYFLMFLIAKIFNVPTICIGLGLKLKKGKFKSWLFKTSLEIFVEKVFLRDCLSYQEAKKILDTSKIEWSVDSAFFLWDYYEGKKGKIHKHKGENLCVTLRKNLNWFNIKMDIKSLPKNEKYCFINFEKKSYVTGEKDFFSKLVAKDKKFITIYDFSIKKLEKCLENCKFMITMRHHGVIISLLFDIPFISIPYHEKTIGLLKDIGLEKRMFGKIPSEEDLLKVAEFNIVEKSKILKYKKRCLKEKLKISSLIKSYLK